MTAVKNRRPGSQAVIAFIGDSWVQDPAIEQPLQIALQTEYGDASPGYVGIGGNHGPAPGNEQGIVYRRTGRWNDALRQPGSMAVDLAEATSIDTSTPAEVTLQATAMKFIVHYVRQPNGGTWTYRVDQGPTISVSTAAQARIYTTLGIVAPSGPHSLDIRISVAGSGVTLLGVDIQTARSGIIVDRLGTGGSTAAEYAQANASAWEYGLAALHPDLVILLLGTNDQIVGETPSAYATAMTTILQRVRAATPRAAIMLVGPSDNGVPHRYQVAQYVDVLQSVARYWNVPDLNTYALIGAYQTVAQQLYRDRRHLDSLGGQEVAGALLQMIQRSS